MSWRDLTNLTNDWVYSPAAPLVQPCVVIESVPTPHPRIGTVLTVVSNVRAAGDLRRRKKWGRVRTSRAVGVRLIVNRLPSMKSVVVRDAWNRSRLTNGGVETDPCVYTLFVTDKNLSVRRIFFNSHSFLWDCDYVKWSVGAPENGLWL